MCVWACVGFSQSAVSRVVTRAAAGSQAFALDESEQKIKEKVEKEHKTEKKRENKKKREKKKRKESSSACLAPLVLLARTAAVPRG